MMMSILELHIHDGMFTFDLTWKQIQSLLPTISNPSDYLKRNPEFIIAGNMMQLTEFLTMAKESSVGVLISLEHAAYLADNLGLDLVKTTMDALDKSGLSDERSKKIMIASTDSAILMKFKNRNGYELVYRVNENINSITNSTISEIKNCASSVIINKETIFPTNFNFFTAKTQVVLELQTSNLSVYVQLFSNEYDSQAWDFFSDAYVEINSFVLGMSVDGVITDYPATATRYRRNRCLGYKELPTYMRPIKPGHLFQFMDPHSLPPPWVPNPVLTELPHDHLETNEVIGNAKGDGKKALTAAIVGSLLGGIILALVSICAFFLYHRRRKKSESPRSVEETRESESPRRVEATGGSVSDQVASNITHHGPSTVEPLSVTNNFGGENISGKGGFSTVYKGELRDGTKIAVKRTDPGVMTEKGLDEFKNKIKIVSETRHRYLVALRGYYLDVNERILVYEYMPNGILSKHLFEWMEKDLKPLEWMQRLTIALDVAVAVEYLHGFTGQGQRCIHRDLKPSNILLGDDMRAKVVDFGLIRIVPNGKSSSMTKIAGTFGYMAPEYAFIGLVSTKVDVYSFGVILMELISGRKALVTSDHSLEKSHISPWFRELQENEEDFKKAVDPTIGLTQENLASLKSVAELANHCCAEKSEEHRPEMSHAVSVLSPLVNLWKPVPVEESVPYCIFGGSKSLLEETSMTLWNKWYYGEGTSAVGGSDEQHQMQQHETTSQDETAAFHTASSNHLAY